MSAPSTMNRIRPIVTARRAGPAWTTVAGVVMSPNFVRIAYSAVNVASPAASSRESTASAAASPVVGRPSASAGAHR